jgi:hypothetical protein
MAVRGLLTSAKTILDAGKWQSGTMPRTAFPLSKSNKRAYRLGNRQWRVVRFLANGHTCRLLINYSAALGQYQAMLGVEAAGDMQVVISLELHPTHDPWHAHVACGPIASVPYGIRRSHHMKRMCGRGKKHAMSCPTTDESAFARAVSFFGLDKTAGEGKLL